MRLRDSDFEDQLFIVTGGPCGGVSLSGFDGVEVVGGAIRAIKKESVYDADLFVPVFNKLLDAGFSLGGSGDDFVFHRQRILHRFN